MTVLAERPASKVTACALLAAKGTGLWVRERGFQDCIREYSLNVQGVPLTAGALKRELNSLIFKRYVLRIRWSPTGVYDENGQPKLIRISAEDYSDYYTSSTEHWQYILVAGADKLVRQTEQYEAPYFAS